MSYSNSLVYNGICECDAYAIRTLANAKFKRSMRTCVYFGTYFIVSVHAFDEWIFNERIGLEIVFGTPSLVLLNLSCYETAKEAAAATKEKSFCTVHSVVHIDRYINHSMNCWRTLWLGSTSADHMDRTHSLQCFDCEPANTRQCVQERAYFRSLFCLSHCDGVWSACCRLFWIRTLWIHCTFLYFRSGKRFVLLSYCLFSFYCVWIHTCGSFMRLFVRSSIELLKWLSSCLCSYNFFSVFLILFVSFCFVTNIYHNYICEVNISLLLFELPFIFSFV